MASPAIIYRGGELDSVTLISGTATSNIYFDPAFSAVGLGLNGNIIGQGFIDSEGSPTTVSGGDDFWAMFFVEKTNTSAPAITIYDSGDRAAFRVEISTTNTYSLQHNTSATSTPSWVTLSSFTGGGAAYVVFQIKTGSDKQYSFFMNGNMVSSGPFSNSNIGPLSRFTCGPASGVNLGVSQIQISRGIQLVGSRVLTRKADASGSYSQMSGVYSNLVKTVINDATAVISNTTGQKSTFSYQNVTVPEGLEMHNEAWIWNRVKNDGSAPESIKQIAIIDSVEQESPPLPVGPGFQQLPSVFGGLTPAKWDAIQIGMESVDV